MKVYIPPIENDEWRYRHPSRSQRLFKVYIGMQSKLNIENIRQQLLDNLCEYSLFDVGQIYSLLKFGYYHDVCANFDIISFSQSYLYTSSMNLIKNAPEVNIIRVISYINNKYEGGGSLKIKLS